MRRSGKKVMLASLLSAALVCSNMSFVYATEEAPESAASVEAEQAESAEEAESTEQAEGTEEAESTEQTESAEQDESVKEAESAEQTESDEAQTEAETEEQTQDAETEETEGATETDEEAGEELVFVDQDGNEIKPSSLVGGDYTEIAESYDGVENVIKQYEASDEYEENTIMDSYVDENGNLVIVISKGTAKEEATAVSSLFGLNASTVGDAPAVDGSFTGWDDIPASYEFNWNKPDAWVDGVHYTETNSTDVRHEMKLYTDGENVYLKVVFAREFCNGQVANGNDYQFWIDDEQMAAYQVEWPDGSQLANNTAEPGTYEVDVRHRDSSWSYVLTDGAVAYYHINEGNLNNELELKIPMSEFVKQNPNIDLENYSMIGFFTPNLMQGKIYTAGASTGGAPFAAVVFLAVPASYIWLKKKKEGELAPA
ncbi:MAG: hypothetical protein NC337_14635 [Roseburia sp.]|nr:hypothetical protein [Roseburia sp.]